MKQLIYGVFYLALWAGLIGGIYAIQKPVPTCFDGRQNQNEAGIDCGGVCAKVCVPEEILPLVQAGDPKLILLDAATAAAPRVSIVSEVQNRNLDFGASTFEYVFSVHDQAGAVIASFPGHSFIYSGEIKRLAIPNETLPAGSSPAYAKLSLRNPMWTPMAKFPRPKLIIQTVGTAETDGNLVTHGTLVNQDSVDFPAVYLVAVYYNSTGGIVGVTATEPNNVTAGETREFSLFHPTIPGAAPEKTQVFATALNLR